MLGALLALAAGKEPFWLIVIAVIVGLIIWLVIAMALFGYVAEAAWVLRWRLPKNAARLGMSYDAEARGLDRLGCKSLPVLQARTAVRNLLHGTVDGVERFAVEVKRPKITDPAYFLVLGHRLRGRALAAFSVELKGLVDDVSVDEEAAEFLGENPYRDPLPFHAVEVAGNKAFGKYFAVLALRQEDGPAVQGVFRREVQDAFMVHRAALERTGNPHLEVQGAGEWVAVVLPQTMPPLLSALKSRLDFDRPLYEAFAGKEG